MTVTFTPAPRGETTVVRVVHRGWDLLGADGPERRRRNEGGWAGLLPHYRQAVADLAR